MTETALEKLCAFPWPGNIRELQNTLHRACGVCRGPQILPAHLDLSTDHTGDGRAVLQGHIPSPDPATSEEAVAALRKAIVWAWDTNQPKLWPLLRDLLERELVEFTVSKLQGNQTQAAERLDMARGTVIKRMQDYGLK